MIFTAKNKNKNKNENKNKSIVELNNL